MSQQETSDTRDADEPTAVVGIGSSAGGLAALKEFFASVPGNTGAAFVVVRHLDPDQPSLGPELVSEHTGLPVQEAEDGHRLGADEIVFLPPGAALRIEDCVLRLERREHELPTRALVDTFLRSLAEDLEGRAVGVLLSGSGSDGTLGLKAIQQQGGVTMVQHPETAEFGGMPWSALRAGVVDHVEPIPELAAVLSDVLARGMRVAAVSPEDVPESVVRRISAIVRERTGHDFDNYRRSTLRRRMLRRVQLQGVETFDQYYEKARSDPEEVEALFGDLLIGVTEFFRDPEAWEALGDSVIPRIFDQNERDGEVRVWVPGCATGEEVYTVAMLLDEEARDRADAPAFTIFGSDVDEEALSFAREGLYPDGIAESVGRERLERYFSREDGHFRFDRSLRERCIFAPHDLLRDPPFSDLDLICCRNVLIYLQPDVQETVLRVYQYALREGGFLFLGGSESLPASDDVFEAEDDAHRIFRRTEREVPPPTSLLSDTAVSVDARSPRRRAVTARAERAAAPRDRRQVDRVLLQEYGPGAVLIDERREVLEFFGRSRRYLEPAGAGAGSDVLDMALRELRGALRAAHHEAVEKGREATRRSGRVQIGEGVHEHVDITVRPAEELTDRPDRYLVVFEGRPAPEEDERERPPADRASEIERRELEEELRETRQRLQSTIEELESSNEELQSANEELQSMNEELQTAREETQSVNEELQTVNEQLRNKVAALDRAHSDLENLFRSTRIATVFLDKQMRIQRFNPPATDLFRMQESDVGRSVEDIAHRFEGGDLEEDVREVIDTLVPAEREVRGTDDGRWYSLRISPYRTVEDVIEGVVLTFTDITRIKHTEERLRRERGYAQSIVQTVSEPLVVLGPELRVRSAGRAFYRTFGLTPDEVQGRPFLDLHPDGWNLSEERLDRVRAGQEAVEGVEVVTAARGGRRVLELTARPITPPDTGDEPGDRLLVTMQDVTDARAWEREKREEARRKDWFLTVLGHELRNPLASVMSGLDLLEGGQLGEEERDEVVAMMRRQAEQLRRLVDDLLDLSRITSGEVRLEAETIDLTEVVQEAVRDHRREIGNGNRDLGVELPDGPLRLRADAARVRQMLANLLDNARKFTSPGDRITVRLEHAAGRGEALLSVADTGRGMEEADLQRVFDPFERGARSEDLDAEGLGIGLTLVRELAEVHGGSAEAHSEGPGEGAEVVVRLPTEARRPASSDGDGHRAAAVPDRLRILVVEDQAITATMLQRLLETAGHEVTTVRDGETALETAREFRPDVVLCDLGLPGSMDGNDVAHALRSDGRLEDTRLVAVSGYGQEADRERSLAAGFDAYLVKPIRDAELMETLAGLFRERA